MTNARLKLRLLDYIAKFDVFFKHCQIDTDFAQKTAPSLERFCIIANIVQNFIFFID